MSRLNDFLHSVPPYIVLLSIFLGPFLESSFFLGFVFPGETAVIFGSSVASYNHVSVVFCFIAAVGGAISGDYIGYLVGRFFGDHVIYKYYNKYRKLQVIVDSARSYINKYGSAAVFFGRFTAIMRAMVPFICGNVKMKKSMFFRWNVLGGLTWGSLFVVVGYFLGNLAEKLIKFMGVFGILIFIVFIVMVVVYTKRHSKKKKKDGLGTVKVKDKKYVE